MNIQLSVVIPTYRRPELLLNCLRAVYTQRFAAGAFEIIVVSDGADPLSEKAVTAFNKHRALPVQYYALPAKKGPAAARNYGWLLAKGALIVFTDDDCQPANNWLCSYYERFVTDKSKVFTGKTIVPLPACPTDYERNVAHLEEADFITANCACSKRILLATGGFDEQFATAWREDSDLEFKLIKAGIWIEKVESAVVTHPVRTAKWGVSIKEQKKTMYNALLYKKWPELYRQKIQPNPPVYYYATLSFFLLMPAGGLLKTPLLITAGLTGWLALSVFFAFRRLKFTSRKPRHLLEMAVTSLLIPFLSVYWQFYGAFKYRVLFL
ncbi:glycosyltransferase [Mucilaginibacter sp.]|uniref:glycosyltransferase family 2 protein n=1 Tax=Mucilaginibacter sp. TaxID=1882438 RepID=UPI00261DD470|nr:glycosyltransferase [Mucilaginibacter sp.]MDB4920738.1 glycosyl transferase family 2 [Mucilaginibacter sp.]